MKDLTEGKVGRLILNFAIPIILGQFLQQAYIIVDRIVIGNYLGVEAQAAVGACFPIIFALISLIVGVATGFAIIISQFFGAKQYEQVKRTIDTLNIFLFIAAILVSIFGIMFSTEILEIMHLPTNIMHLAQEYLQIYLIGFVSFFGYNGISAILRGLGDSKTPLVFMAISSIINILLDLLFVIVFGWGISGVAYATIIAQSMALIAAIWYLNKKHELINFSIKKLIFDTSIFKKSLKIGLPTGLQHTFVSFGMLALMIIVTPFGSSVIAAYTVAGTIDMLAGITGISFSIALSAFVGQNIGAGKINRAKKGLGLTSLMVGGITIIISGLVLLFKEPIIEVFINISNTTSVHDISEVRKMISIGIEYLAITAPFYIIFSFMFVIHGALRGAGDTFIPMFITLLSLWIIRVPLSYIMSRVIEFENSWIPSFISDFLLINLGTKGIWWGIPMAWSIGMVLSLLYYYTGRWEKMSIVEKQAEVSIQNA